jgi:hypothetical protein
MLVLVALGCFPLLWWLFASHGHSRRLAFLLAAVAWASYLVTVTELLGLARMLAPLPLALAWVGLLVPLAILVSPTFSQRRELFAVPSCDGRTWAIVTVVAGFLALLLAVALVAPPNTWDSMTYHMARVAHWVQNRSVAPYATSNGRQIHMGPGAEFVILHLQLLTGCDRLANSVQWFALIGSILGVSLIARGLGAGPRGQLFAAALCASIPMGICQATSTQNDLVVAFWLVCFVAIGFAARAADGWARRRRAVLLVAAGLSLGMALLAKATAYIFVLPLALLLLSLVPGAKLTRVGAAVAVLLLAMLVNAGFFARNAAACGNPLGPGVEDVGGEIHTYVNEEISPVTFTSNVLRNVALELYLPFPAWNDHVADVVRVMHSMMGILPSDRRMTLTGQRFSLDLIPFHEDTSPAPIILTLFVVTIVTGIARRTPGWRLTLSYALCLVVSFLLFCVLLKWQPWHARLHLPIVALACPLVGTFIEANVNRRFQAPLVIFILLTSLPTLLLNPSRPVVGRHSVFAVPRTAQYFVNHGDYYATYAAVASAVARERCDRVGLVSSFDAWEYPLWLLLQRANPNVIIEQLEVGNYTRAYAKPFDPCVIIRIDKQGQTVVERR